MIPAWAWFLLGVMATVVLAAIGDALVRIDRKAGELVKLLSAGDK